MKNNKLFVLLLLGIMLVSFASAVKCDENLGSFKTNSVIKLYQSCPTCSYVNLETVKDANGTLITIDENMDKVGYDFFYNYSNTSMDGEYFYTVIGDKDGSLESETICFIISPNGMEFGSSQNSAFLIGTIVLLLLATLLGIMAFKMKHNVVRVGALSFAILIMIFTFGFTANVLENTLGNSSDISSTFSTFYTVMIYISAALAIGLILWLIVIALNVYRSKRGLTMDE